MVGVVSYGHQGADETGEQDASVGRDDFPWGVKKKIVYITRTRTQNKVPHVAIHGWLI